MAAKSSVLGAPAGAPAPRPRRGPEPARRQAIGVVDRRQVLERARRRQARVLLSLSAVIVAVALGIAAAGHAMLAAEQVRADSLRADVASATATQQNLQLRRAELETPSRVLSIAEHRFKMVAPTGVTYLQPVNPGQSVEQASRAKAASRTAGHRSSPSKTAGSR